MFTRNSTYAHFTVQIAVQQVSNVHTRLARINFSNEYFFLK